jgi:hypothetical protein
MAKRAPRKKPVAVEVIEPEPLPPPVASVEPSRGFEPTYDEPAAYHAVARCRWCDGRFRRTYGFQWLCENYACAIRQIAHAVLKPSITDDSTPFLFLPLPLQVDIEESPVKRLLVHGAAGVSKSYGGRWGLYKRCRQFRGYRALLLRCTGDQLYKNHLQFMPGEAAELGDAKCLLGTNAPKQMKFDNGAVVFMGYCQHLDDIAQHLGPEWDEVLFEEAVHFLPKALQEISARDRGSASGREALAKAGLYEGRTRYLTNPGGIAMTYLEDICINKNPDPLEFPHYDPQFYGEIRGSIIDNPYLSETFASSTLGGLEGKRYQQLAEGRWDVFPGQFFPDWQPQHTVDLDAEIAGCPRVAVVVWGYNRPGYVLWASLLPNGRVYLTDEWKFSGLTVPDVAAELSKRHDGQSVRLLGDLSLDAKTTPDIVTVESTRHVFARYGQPVQLIDAAETHGWQRVHDYLRVGTDGAPWLQASPRCAYLKRSLPTLIADEREPDDLAKGQDDRAALALRTLLASRPAPGVIESRDDPPAYMTIGWFKAQDEKAESRNGPLRRLHQ